MSDRRDSSPLTAPFPDSFTWGVATSSYQIEGAAEVDGRGPSIWDTFCAQPGAIEDGSSGEVACDHYHRYEQDVALFSDALGVNGYRFSVAWPRVMPSGRGAVNAAGLDFYDRLVDTLLEAGITPCPTLYHWDLPQPLEDAGGWPNRGTVDAFAEYTQAVVGRLKDRVTQYITINEAWCAAWLGYAEGAHAPGIKDPKAALAAIHHLLMAHGRATQIIRSEVPGASVGLAHLYLHAMPASDSAADKRSAVKLDGFFNRWFLDPIYRGAYPEDVIEDHRRDGHLESATLPFEQPGDMALISTPTTLLGVNYYTRGVARSAEVDESENAPRMISEAPPEARTDMDWEIYPDGLRAALVRCHRDYGPNRIDVTENGCAFDTPPDSKGRVADVRRIAYLRSHLASCREALEQGVPLGAYYLWSAFDNFEWAFGYAKRFGIIWVDFDSGRRILKDSARWYASLIANQGVERTS